MYKSKMNHPWRARTREFSKHVDALPNAQQRQIKSAEREFLAKCDAPFSPQRQALRDFCTDMTAGVHETVDSE